MARLGPTTSLVRTTLPAARARPCDRRGARKKHVGVVKNRNDFILSERPVGIFVRRFEDRLHQRLPRASGVGAGLTQCRDRGWDGRAYQKETANWCVKYHQPLGMRMHRLMQHDSDALGQRLLSAPQVSMANLTFIAL